MCCLDIGPIYAAPNNDTGVVDLSKRLKENLSRFQAGDIAVLQEEYLLATKALATEVGIRVPVYKKGYVKMI